MSKRVLVTGGAGFLGSYLCARLLAAGCRVTALDNFLTGQERNVEPLRGHPDFQFVHHDVTEPFDAEVEEVYNLACPASPPHYQRDPVYTTRTSVLGALNVLELARRHGARVLQASTSEIYGDPEVHPQPESYRGSVNPIGPRACYDEGKRVAETLFFDYHRAHGVPIRVVRIFNTYGPNMHPGDGRVVSNFIVQALTGRALTVYGDGSQTRSFCYADDLVEGLILAMNAADPFTGPVNLGNPYEFTVLELARRVLRLTGSGSRIVHHPLPMDDPTQRQPDITLARRELGWEPKIGLEDGLRRTIQYFKSLSDGRGK